MKVVLPGSARRNVSAKSSPLVEHRHVGQNTSARQPHIDT
jgi:hypothetical protein